MLDTVLAALLPYVLEILALVVSGIIYSAAKQFKKLTGVEIEARHRETLHSAIMTGINYAIARNLPPDTAVAMAVSYAETQGAPDAVAALKVTEERLTAIARAKLAGVK